VYLFVESNSPYDDLAKSVEAKMNLKSLRFLDITRPLFILPNDPLAEEILIPGFKNAHNVDCMVGFFSSEVLASLAPGLATYINSTQNSFRLVISPLIRAEDQAAIEDGFKAPEDVVQDILEEIIITEDLLKIHTLKCLTWMLREKRLEIKVALMKGAIFHPKVWLFKDGEDVVAVHGSSNVTYAGIIKNIEQIAISRSWQDQNQHYITERLCEEFSRLWQNKNDFCMVIGMPEAVQQRLLRTYKLERPPTEVEFKDIYFRASTIAEENQYYKPSITKQIEFTLPSTLKYEEGPFEHQGKAVAAWCDAGFRGVLEMATGSGKTITSMIAAYRLYEREKPLMIVIAAPYVPLIEQWCEELLPFGLKPVNLTIVGNAIKRSKELQRLSRRLRTGLTDVEVVVVSHDTLCTEDFYSSIEGFNCSRLLIADEVHNLGRLNFINKPPECFDYRIGLSATPIRQYDEEGTEALFNFFGPVVFKYTLEEAIGRCLVQYDYYIHPVHLTETEMSEWFDITGKIRQNAWRSKDEKPDEYIAKLLRDRRAILETAYSKLSMLETLLNNEAIDGLRHTLIYTSDKGPDQLKRVNDLLRKKNIMFHQLTAEETYNRKQTKQIIKAFQHGEIQVLTAKRVLDEGVNIPQICKAFILASTTVERQWIQRRGRLLRTCNEINKSHSVIHDMIVLPPNIELSADQDIRALVRTELIRAQAFASLARNAGRPDGPLSMIKKLIRIAYM
jgi:superfamily II DNA or RNA helicase